LRRRQRHRKIAAVPDGAGTQQFTFGIANFDDRAGLPLPGHDQAIFADRKIGRSVGRSNVRRRNIRRVGFIAGSVCQNDSQIFAIKLRIRKLHHKAAITLDRPGAQQLPIRAENLYRGTRFALARHLGAIIADSQIGGGIGRRGIARRRRGRRRSIIG